MSQFSDNRRPGHLSGDRQASHSTPEATIDEKPFRLAKSFSTVAIVLIFGAVLTLATVVSRQAEIIITKRVEDDTIKLMENLNHQMFEGFLIVARTRFGEIRLREPVQQEMLHRIISNTIYGFDIKHVLIYNTEGQVVFATDETPLESMAEDTESFQKAIDLYVPSPTNPWRLGDRFFMPPDLLQRYVPQSPQMQDVLPGTGRLPLRGGIEIQSFAALWNNALLESESSPDETGTGPAESGEGEDSSSPSPLGLSEKKETGDDETSAQSPSQPVESSAERDEESYLENLRQQTVFRYEGGQYLFFNFFPSGDFVLRGYKAMENYGNQGLSGVLEISRDLTPEFRQIAKLQYFALSMAAFLALFLSIILRRVVSRGEAILNKRNLERQALREQLDQAERLAGLGSMVATVAHEIRNPLGIIHSTADVLNRFLAPEPDKARLARAIVEEANRLSDVVTEFLDFARPPTPRLAPIVVEEILEEILAFLEVTLSRAGVELRCDFRDDQTSIPGDGAMLHRAFLNILVNAVQAMEDGGLICVETSLEPGLENQWLLVRISDTGPGLSEEATKKLFSPFYTTKAKGTGLGLVIVRNIIESHGGRIEMKNGAARPSDDDCGRGLIVEIRLAAGSGQPTAQNSTT